MDVISLLMSLAAHLPKGSKSLKNSKSTALRTGTSSLLHFFSRIPAPSPSAEHHVVHHQGGFANQKATALTLAILKISHATLGMPIPVLDLRLHF